MTHRMDPGQQTIGCIMEGLTAVTFWEKVLLSLIFVKLLSFFRNTCRNTCRILESFGSYKEPGSKWQHRLSFAGRAIDEGEGIRWQIPSITDLIVFSPPTSRAQRLHLVARVIMCWLENSHILATIIQYQSIKLQKTEEDIFWVTIIKETPHPFH